MQETWVQSLGWEDPLEEGMAALSSSLAWRITMDREAWLAAVRGVAKNLTRLSNRAHTHPYRLLTTCMYPFKCFLITNLFNLLTTVQGRWGYCLHFTHGKMKSLKSEVKWSESCSVVSNSLWSHVLYSPWNSLGQNTGVGSHSLLQGIFPTQGLNPGLPHCGQILYQLSRKGSL